MSASAGGAAFPEQGDDYVSLCRRADVMLYDVKRNGKADFKITEDLKMELGDAIYSLLFFAIENGIDPKEVLKSAIEKYENRMIKKGHIGSNQ